MTPAEQEILLASLEKTCDAFFRKRAQKKTAILMANGQASAVDYDATGLLVVLSQWVGDLIAGAPQHMQDALFMSFADTVVTVAGIKSDEHEQETMQ